MDWSTLICISPMVVIIIAMLLLRRVKGSQSPRSNVIIIDLPTLGIYNLSGDDFAPIINIDKKSLGHFFSSVIESTSAPPTCNVLFLYCHIDPDGGVHESHLGLREIIRDSGALIVIVASENSAENYQAANKETGYGYANLVMTLDRKGDKFTTFYQRLFTEMKQGVSMPVAWNKLAPQIPGVDHIDSPDGFGVWGAGQVAFK